MFLEYNNGKHPNIKFSNQHEHDKKLNFLDCIFCLK